MTSTSMQEMLSQIGFQAGQDEMIRKVADSDIELWDATNRQDLEGVSKALEAGANPNVKHHTPLGDMTCIFVCAEKGYTQIAEQLIEYGANIKKALDFDKSLCLHHAASHGQTEMCKLFIEKGCDVDYTDRLGRTALMDAAEIGSMDTMRLLITHKANVNIVDNEGFPALSYCVDFAANPEELPFYEISKYLIECGSDISVKGRFTKRSILHCAAAQGDLEYVRQLVHEHGGVALIFKSDNQHKKPIDYAKSSKHDDVVSYLEQQQANVNQTSGCCVVL